MASKYQSIEDLIFQGFLTTKVQVGEETLVLKSLNHRELAQISLRCPLRGSKGYDQAFEKYLITYALYMVGGENVLEERPGNIHELFQVVGEIPPNIRQDLLREILYLQRALDSSLKRLEAYSYEPESRHHWSAYRGHRVNDPLLTGVPGTGALGLNTHQVAWVYLNTEEDDRVASEEQWMYAKFVASAANAKGVKKVEEKDRNRLKKLHEIREQIRKGEEYVGPIRVEVTTAADLRSQLLADVDGKKDLHDRIIEEYEASIQKRKAERRERFEAEMEQRKKDRNTRFEEMSDEEFLANQSGFITVLTPDQLKKHKDQKNKERQDLVARVQEGRKKANETWRADREVASENIRRMVEREGKPDSLELETDNNGPRPPERGPAPPPTAPRAPGAVDTRPAPNPRLAGAPAPKADTPPTAPQTQFARSLPSGTPPGMSREEKPTMAGPSSRLTRQYPVPYAKKPKAPGHMTHIDTPDQEDFFAGGGTKFGEPQTSGKK